MRHNFCHSETRFLSEENKRKPKTIFQFSLQKSQFFLSMLYPYVRYLLRTSMAHLLVKAYSYKTHFFAREFPYSSTQLVQATHMFLEQSTCDTILISPETMALSLNFDWMPLLLVISTIPMTILIAGVVTIAAIKL